VISDRYLELARAQPDPRGRIGARYAAELGTIARHEQIDGAEAWRSPVSHSLLRASSLGYGDSGAHHVRERHGHVVGISPPRARWASPTAISSMGALLLRPLDCGYSLIKSYCFAAGDHRIPATWVSNPARRRGVGRATTTEVVSASVGS